MFTFVYDKENGHQQDNSWYVYIFTENALKRLHKLQFCLSYHIISHLVFLYVSWLNDTIAIGPRLRKPVFGDLQQ